MIFDTHAHYDSGAFNADRFQILDGMPEKNVGLIVDPGCDLESSRAAVALAEKYDFVYAAVGWHPEDIDKFSEEAFSELKRLAQHPKCVAVGEIGLDYYWDSEHKDEQKELFRRQIELALELNKPVIVHDREAHGACLDAVCRHEGVRGVFHGFSGSAEMAKELVRRGFFIAFGGALTYRGADRLRAVAASVPPDRLLLETDCPYMPPVPLRGTVNRSDNILHIARVLAPLHGMTQEELADITNRNAVRLFGLDAILPNLC